MQEPLFSKEVLFIIMLVVILGPGIYMIIGAMKMHRASDEMEDE